MDSPEMEQGSIFKRQEELTMKKFRRLAALLLAGVLALAVLSGNGDDSDEPSAKDMTAFGAAARTIGGKTYMAIGMTFELTMS